MPINAELFREIADVIEKHPDNHQQGIWMSNDGMTTNKTQRTPYFEADKFGCNTLCCIAGFAVLLTPEDARPDEDFISEAAAVLLGLNPEEGMTLFSSHFRPIDMTVSAALRKIADTGEMLQYHEYTIEPLPLD